MPLAMEMQARKPSLKSIQMMKNGSSEVPSVGYVNLCCILSEQIILRLCVNTLFVRFNGVFHFTVKLWKVYYLKQQSL